MKLRLRYLSFSGSEKPSSSSKKRYPTIIQELCHQFSLEDLQKSTNIFDEALKVGQGGFGSVYRGYDLRVNGAIAVKRIARSSNQGFGAFKKEIELLCQFRHPNLVSLIGFCNDNDEKILVYEYMPNGSLHDCLYHHRDMEPLSWKQRLDICIGAARGLHYLHSGAKRPIFHCDLKHQSILLDDKMVPKLSDLGLYLLGPLYPSRPKVFAGTYGYMASEYNIEGSLIDKYDVYSFGMVLLEMICTMADQMIIGHLKLPSHCPANVALLIFSKQFPVEDIIDPVLEGKIAPECWEAYRDITQRCLR